MNDPISLNTAEPTLEQLAALRKASGDEQSTIHFERIAGGTRVTIRTTEQPPREWSTTVDPASDEHQRKGVYDEFASRIERSAGKSSALNDALAEVPSSGHARSAAENLPPPHAPNAAHELTEAEREYGRKVAARISTDAPPRKPFPPPTREGESSAPPTSTPGGGSNPLGGREPSDR